MSCSAEICRHSPHFLSVLGDLGGLKNSFPVLARSTPMSSTYPRVSATSAVNFFLGCPPRRKGRAGVGFSSSLLAEASLSSALTSRDRRMRAPKRVPENQQEFPAAR